MFPSASLCRSQQAYHLKRARDADLDNVRAIAGKAAIAWQKEAEVAEDREARRVKTREVADRMVLERNKRGHVARAPDESPDHELADVRICR